MGATATEATERPLPLRDYEVRSVLAGRKTQHRVIVKPQPYKPDKTMLGALANHDDWVWPYPDGEGHHFRVSNRKSGPSGWEQYCPLGRVGDLLWVRETHELYKGISTLAALHDATYCCFPDGSQKFKSGEYCPWNKPVTGSYPSGHRWRPSTSMPRWASRLTLRITSVRIEQLQAISEADAVTEGFDRDLCASVLRQAAGKARMEFGRWLELPDGSEPDGYWCLDCVAKEAKKRRAKIRGWNECFDSDHAPHCEHCGIMLHHSLTRYGIETELDLTDEESVRTAYTPKTGDSALALAELAEGMGDWSKEFMGRLAQIGFGTSWERTHGDGSWDLNSWIWVIGFERVV